MVGTGERRLLVNDRILYGVIAAALCVLALGCEEEVPPDQVAEPVLRVGTDATFPPFEFPLDSTGEPTGFDIDLIAEICARCGWEYEIVDTPFVDLLPALQAQELQLAISGISITPRRRATVRFSDPYYLVEQAIVVSEGDALIDRAGDLRGMRVGVLSGSTGEVWAKDIDGLLVFPYPELRHATDALEARHIDVLIVDHPSVRPFLDSTAGYRAHRDILNAELYGIAAGPADTVRISAINDALAELLGDGTFDSLHTVWFGEPFLAVPDTSSPRKESPAANSDTESGH